MCYQIQLSLRDIVFTQKDANILCNEEIIMNLTMTMGDGTLNKTIILYGLLFEEKGT